MNSFSNVMRNWLSEVANLAAGEVAKLLSDSVTTADKEIASVKGEEKDLGVTTIRIGITIESRQVYCLVNVRNNLQTIRDGVSVPLNGDPMVLVSGIGTKAAELISFLKAAPNGYQI